MKDKPKYFLKIKNLPKILQPRKRWPKDDPKDKGPIIRCGCKCGCDRIATWKVVRGFIFYYACNKCSLEQHVQRHRTIKQEWKNRMLLEKLEASKKHYEAELDFIHKEIARLGSGLRA